MNKTELSKLLAVASAVDNRRVTPETVEAWHLVVGHLSLDVAHEALLMHQRDSTDYLMPAHIVANAKRVRARREREQRMSRPAIEPNRITLDRAQFEADTLAAIEAHRKEREAS